LHYASWSHGENESFFFAAFTRRSSALNYDTGYRAVVPEPTVFPDALGCLENELMQLPGIPLLNVTGDVARLKHIPCIMKCDFTT